MRSILRSPLVSRSALAGAALLLLAPALSAQRAPGVGFNPQGLAQLVSRYWVRDPQTGALSQRSFVIDFSVLDALSNGTEFERRWGPGSFSRLKWVGPDNELTTTVATAMQWAFTNQPALLGVASTGAFDGQPTQLEVIDACATGYGTQIVVAYAQATWPGGSPDRPIVISDPTKPRGDFSAPNPYWPLTIYYHNKFRGFLPVSPQVPLAEQ